MSNLNQFVQADRAMTENHIIDWNGAKSLITDQREKPGRQMKPSEFKKQ